MTNIIRCEKTGHTIVHRIRLTGRKSIYSAWYDENGDLFSAERRHDAPTCGHSTTVAKESPAWRELHAKRRVFCRVFSG